MTVTEQIIMYVPLLAALVWAAAGDVASRRIPNYLTFSLVLVGLAQSLTPWAVTRPLSSLSGLGVGFALPLVGYVLGGMKAGDVKLMAGVGAWLGPLAAFQVFAVAAIAGAAYVLLHGLWHRRLVQLARDCGTMAINLRHARKLGLEHVADTGARTASAHLPYAIFVLAGAAAVIVAQAVVGIHGGSS